MSTKSKKKPPPAKGDRYLDKAEVLSRLGISYSLLHCWTRRGDFPAPRILNGSPDNIQSRVAWLESEVAAWMASRPRRTFKPLPQEMK